LLQTSTAQAEEEAEVRQTEYKKDNKWVTKKSIFVRGRKLEEAKQLLHRNSDSKISKLFIV